MSTEVQGLADFRRELKALDASWPKELTKVHKDLAKRVEARARMNVAGLSRQQAAAASAIRGSGTQSKASVGVSATAKVPWARAAIWGGSFPTGWYAEDRFGGPDRVVTGDASQFPPWVGNHWEAGVYGQGPYGINAAVAAMKPGLERDYLDMVSDLAARAFPD